jgi:hypothetical protein
LGPNENFMLSWNAEAQTIKRERNRAVLII